MICGRLDPLITDGERKQNSTSVGVWDPELVMRVMILYQTIDGTPGSRRLVGYGNSRQLNTVLSLNRPGS
jgi:hypothetical protein